MDALRKVGDVAGTGLGVALTPLAMAQAARAGRNPLELLQEIQQAGELQQQKQLFERAKNLQEPGVRNLLVSQPELAGALNVETVPGGIASPEVLARARGTGATPGGLVPMLPERYVSPTETAASARQNYFNQLSDMAKEAQAAGGRVSYGPSGPSISPPAEMDVREGEMNPGTQQPYKPGEVGPTGSRVRRVVPLATTRTAQQTQNLLSRLNSASAQLDALTGPLIDPKTKKAYMREDPNQIDPVTKKPKQVPVTYRDALLGTDVPSALYGEIPFLPEAATRVRARQGGAEGAAAQALTSLSGMVSSVARIGGEVGNLAAEEQKRFMDAFVPTARDSVFSGPQKEALLRQVIANTRAALEAGGTPEDVANIFRTATDQAMGIGQGASTVPGATPGAPAAEVPDEVKSARDRLDKMFNAPPPVARQSGGPVAPRQLALVGENGPELAQSAGPMTITPLKVGMGPGVSAPDYAPAIPPAKMLQPKGGLGKGEGLTDKDTAAVRGGAKGTITLGPDGLPVFVRQ